MPPQRKQDTTPPEGNPGEHLVDLFAPLKDSELLNARQAARRASEWELAAAITKELASRRAAKQAAAGQQLLLDLLKNTK